MSRLPRIRAWIFCSVVSSGKAGKKGGQVLMVGLHGRRNADDLKAAAQVFRKQPGIIDGLLGGVGRRHGDTQTFSGPRARQPITAVTAESMPPDNPSTAL